MRGGGHTDAVAAIAGGLLGAAYGASAIPAEWRRVLHGWAGLRSRGLVDLASAVIRKGEPDPFDFTYGGYRLGVVARHPYDDAVWLGDMGALRSLPDGVDAVVSLCRVGDADVPACAQQIDVRLIDQPGVNDNLDFVLLDTVRLVEQLRREGRTVLIHCVQAQSRTPAVAGLYGATLCGIGITEALVDVCAVLPAADPIPEFRGRCDDFIRWRTDTGAVSARKQPPRLYPICPRFPDLHASDGARGPLTHKSGDHAVAT